MSNKITVGTVPVFTISQSRQGLSGVFCIPIMVYTHKKRQVTTMLTYSEISVLRDELSDVLESVDEGNCRQAAGEWTRDVPFVTPDEDFGAWEPDSYASLRTIDGAITDPDDGLFNAFLANTDSGMPLEEPRGDMAQRREASHE